METYSNTALADAASDRQIWPAMLNGARCRCPACGEGRLFKGYIEVEPVCNACGQELHHQRADDAPPYFTMFIVGHVIVGGVLTVEQTWAPETWVHLAIWLPLTVGLSLLLLPRIKGALVGLQWALRMHGFASPGSADAAAGDPIDP